MNSITLKGIRKQIEEEDSKDYGEEKAFFAETIQECLEKRLEKEAVRQEENVEESEDNSVVDEDEDFRMALKLQQEEQARSSGKINLRRRASGNNRKYQEGLIIKPSKRKSDTDAAQTDANKPKRTLNKPLILSPEMAAVFDNEFSELTRPEVVKKLWEYIKKHDLQDPKDKRFILCDEKLTNVFNRPRVNCFKMAKFMSAHLHRKEDLSGTESVPVVKPKQSQTPSQPKTASSPKKQKISNEIVEDSDEEASEMLNEVKMNPLLLNIPGVSAEMSFSSVQAAVLAYTQAMKLRDPSDPDVIIVKPTSPIAKLMGERHNGGNVHILDFIQRVHYLFDHKNAK